MFVLPPEPLKGLQMPEQDTRKLPIPHEAERQQSLFMLRLAEREGLIARFAWPTDMADEAQVARHRGEFGDTNWPEDDLGVYYAFYVIPRHEAATEEQDIAAARADAVDKGSDPDAAEEAERKRKRIPVVLPEGEVKPFIIALAVAAGEDVARRFLYRWSLIPR